MIYYSQGWVFPWKNSEVGKTESFGELVRSYARMNVRIMLEVIYYYNLSVSLPIY